LGLRVPVLRRFDQFVVLFANAEGIRRLREEPGILGISGDLPVIAAMSVAEIGRSLEVTREPNGTGTIVKCSAPMRIHV
jgi:hypothetical protein